MPKPGLMFVTSKIFDESKLSDAKYNEFYDKEHLPDVLGYKKSPVALRYKNTNKESPRGPYLALYPLEDVDFLLGDGLKKMVEETKNSKVIGGDMYEYIEFGLRPYELIQTFEGQGFENTSGKDRGKTLVCVAMAPAEGTDSEFDEWYRKQHLDMLSMCAGYRRSTRYRFVGEGQPRYLALHEYACEAKDLPADQIKLVTGTEWSKKIIGEAKVFDRDVWELIQAQGDVSAKL